MLAALLGLLAGAVLTVVVVVGESQVRLAASGAVVGLGQSGVVMIDPQWATLVAFALALVVMGTAALVWEVARRRATRAFWLAAAAVPAAVVVIGTPMAPVAFDARRRGSLEDILAATAHSPLLCCLVIAAVAAGVMSTAAVAPRQPAERR